MDIHPQLKQQQDNNTTTNNKEVISQLETELDSVQRLMINPKYTSIRYSKNDIDENLRLNAENRESIILNLLDSVLDVF